MFIGRKSNFFFRAEDGIRDYDVTGVQTCALPISLATTTTDAVTRYKEFGGAYTEADADWVAVRLEAVRVELGPEQSHEEADSRLEDGDDTRGQVRAAARRVTASLLMAPLRLRGVAPGHHLRCTKGARNMTQATKATRAMKAGEIGRAHV